MVALAVAVANNTAIPSTTVQSRDTSTPIVPTNARERELVERATRDYRALTAVGLTTGETFFPPGTEVGQGWAAGVSQGKIRRARAEAIKLPVAREALGALADQVLAEDRRDLAACLGFRGAVGEDIAGLADIYPSPLGGLSVGDDSLAPTETAMRQIMSRNPAPDVIPSADIARWLTRAERAKVILRTRKLPAHRTEAYSDARELYGVVTDSYKPYDLDAAAHDLAECIPHDAKARIKYDGARARVDIVLQNPYVLSDGSTGAAVGETHQVVLRMRTSDDGSGGYHLSLLAQRVRCINLTLLHATRSLFHASHRREDLRDLAQGALAQVGPTMAVFADTWREGWSRFYADRFTKAPISGEEAIKRIVAAGKFRISGLGKDGTEAACLAALTEEPGDTANHVHNALTRAAHTSPTTWASRWADEEAEEQASKLLYQRVQWLAEPEVAQA